MQKNTSLLMKFTNLMEKLNKLRGFQSFQRPTTFWGYVTNIIRFLVSWFLSTMLTFYIYSKLPQSLPDGLRKFILVCCYFGLVFFFAYFPFSKYVKKLKDKLTFNKKMENKIEEIGKNPESE